MQHALKYCWFITAVVRKVINECGEIIFGTVCGEILKCPSLILVLERFMSFSLFIWGNKKVSVFH